SASFIPAATAHSCCSARPWWAFIAQPCNLNKERDMAYFEWAEDMVIDGGPIDKDHRLLVDLVNELHTATARGAGREVVASILSRTLSSTREHLTREETLMQQM